MYAHQSFHNDEYVRVILTISTSHLPKEHSWIIDYAEYTNDWGWIVYTGAFQFANQNLMDPFFRNILAYAHGRGFDWVCFDADAPILDEFPVWDW